jgi:alkylresorcinol/alkylpyrone synthase
VPVPRAVLRGLATASPGEPVPQERLKRQVAELWIGSDAGLESTLRVFDTCGVTTRHLALAPEEYPPLTTFARRNARYVERARALALEAASKALARAGLEAADVTHVVFVSSTGISTPSLDAHLVNELALPGTVRRVPLWGLGCAGGAAGLGLAAELVRGGPEAVVLLVAVELCSLAFVPIERSTLNVLASALFADGAAAAVVAAGGSGPALGVHRSTTWPDTLGTMAMQLTEGGLSLSLSREILGLSRVHMGPVLDDLRRAAGWGPTQAPAFLAIHPGASKVLDALGEGLGLEPALLEPSRRVLARHGNMSSPTVLYVLEEILGAARPPAGPGMYSALGPGFTCECGVLDWAG